MSTTPTRPGYGERHADEDGIVCHVRGRTFKALANHVIVAHGFASADAYRQEFGLAARGLVCAATARKLGRAAVAHGLAKRGRRTRFTADARPPAAPLSAEGRARFARNVPPLAEKRRAATHCERGHEFTPANTFMRNGYRTCRECIRESWRRSARARGIPTRLELDANRTCASCGAPVDEQTVGCQSCTSRHHARRKKRIDVAKKLPSFGARVVAADGIQCHVCGEFFRALGVHAVMGHGVASADAYREEFGSLEGGCSRVSSRIVAAATSSPLRTRRGAAAIAAVGNAAAAATLGRGGGRRRDRPGYIAGEPG
jgi:predicted transcriptional regulator